MFIIKKLNTSKNINSKDVFRLLAKWANFTEYDEE